MANPGEAVDTTGTVECICPLFASIPETLDFERENYACVPYLDGRGYVTYAYNISGGAVVRWYRDSLAFYLKQAAKERGCSVYDLLNETCPPEPTGLIVLPFLQGMGGTPDVLTGARGTIYGLTMHTSPADLYRAILEGLTFEMRYNLEKLAKYDIRPTTLFAAGGGAKSPVWRQIKADILGAEIRPTLADEAVRSAARSSVLPPRPAKRTGQPLPPASSTTARRQSPTRSGTRIMRSSSRFTRSCATLRSAMPVDNASAVGTVFDIKQLAVYDGPRHPHDGVFEGLPPALHVVSQPGGAFLSAAADGVVKQLPALRGLRQSLPERREKLHSLRPVYPRLPTGAAEAMREALYGTGTGPKASARQGLSCRNVRRRDLFRR